MAISLNTLNYIMGFLIFTTVLTTLVSFGFMGRELTYYYELTTEKQKEDLPTTYIGSVNAIMAWNIFLFIFLPMTIYGVYKWETTGQIVLGVLYFLFSIAFLEAHKDYDRLQTEQFDIFSEDQAFCDTQMIACVRSNSFVKAQREETAYAVIFSIFGVLGYIVAIMIAKQNDNQPQGDGRNQKYIENS